MKTGDVALPSNARKEPFAEYPQKSEIDSKVLLIPPRSEPSSLLLSVGSGNSQVRLSAGVGI